MALPAEIQTRRLKLRPLVAGDEAALVAALDDLGVARWLSRVPHPYTTANFDRFLDIASPGVHWAIDDTTGFAGLISLEFLPGDQGPPDVLGYWLARRVWGLGYMTEAARAVVGEYLATGADQIASGYFVGNAPSAGVLRKLGFVEVGRSVKDSLSLGPDRPHVDVELTRAGFIAALPIEAKSARLTYRSLQTVDFEALHAIGSDWSVVRQLGSWPWPPERAFTAVRARPYTGDGFVWGLFRQGVMIGTVAVTSGELGYMLDPAHWGQGYASEACRLAINSAFAMGRDHLTAGAWSDNAASLHVMAKLGFKVTGHDVTHSIARKVDAPGHLLRLDRADWPGA